MANQANYAAVPKCGIGQVSVANTNRDGTGDLATIFTAGAAGSRIDRVAVCATGTTTAGMVRLFLHDGTNARLYCEMQVFPATPSGAVKVFNDTFEAVTTPDLFPLVLPTGWSLRASTHNAETLNVIAVGGDF
jgi:hypothetical protein